MKALRALGRVLMALGFLGAVACTSIDSPKSLAADTEFLESFRDQRIENSLLIAPIVPDYQSLEFNQASLKDPKPSYRPSLNSTEQKTLTDKVRNALSTVFTEPVDVLAPLSGDSSADALFRQAEDRGAQLLMMGTLVENRVSYEGWNAVGWFFDVHSLFGLPPSHWWIPDERFSVIRRLRLRFYDVRLPKEVLYELELVGECERTLNEWQHGIVPLNPLRALFDDGDRFGVDQWKTVYRGLSEHADRELQDKLLREMVTGLRPVLKSPAIRQRLQSGDPSQARLYTVLVGQNHGASSRAVGDAEAFAKLCEARLGAKKTHSKLITSAISAKDLLVTLRKLRVKAVDRLVFYFSGLGHENREGAALVLSGGDHLSLEDLAAALRSLQTKRISLILDTSFGDAKRARILGGRTAQGSGVEKAKGPYLGPLLEDSWQLLCAARAGQTTGEFGKHGLLTGFLLSALRDDPRLDFQALYNQIGDRYSRRSQALLGGQHQLFLKTSTEKLEDN